MKLASIAFAILALTIPAVAIAQSPVRAEISIAGAGDLQSSFYETGLAVEDEAVTQEDVAPAWIASSGIVKAAVVVGPRGRAIVRGRGPRGRAFMYRGRPYDRFRAPRFAYPRGYRYRRWGVGQLLPLALLAAPFFFAEYRALGLQEPPPGYRWVRNGNDVVLVNMRTREVEDVAYGAIDDEDY